MGVRDPVSMVVSRSGIRSVETLGDSAAGTGLLSLIQSFLWLRMRSRSFLSARLGGDLRDSSAAVWTAEC